MEYILKNVRLLDGTLDENGKMPVRENVSVYVRDEKIEKIFEAGEKLPDNVKAIDLQGKYLMPGLINLHVHLAASGKPPKKNAKPVDYQKLFKTISAIPGAFTVFRKLEEGLAKKYLYSGVTTVRTVGGVLDLDGQVRDRVNAGKIEGPRLLVCNQAVSVPGGHFAGSLATIAQTPEDAVRDIEKIAATKPDWIKLMITGGVMDATEEGEPGALRMKPEMVKAACEKAHELGYKVAAHVESPEGVRTALENGVDTIEHGALPDEEIIALFKERKAVDVCTLSPTVPYCCFPEEISHCGDLGRKNGTVVMDGIIECANVCLKEGVTVGLGTDSGCNFITPYDMWRELHYFVKYCGVTADFALHTATAVNASVLGLSDVTGTVAEGKSADFVISEKNPLESFENLRTPAMVVYKGRIIEKPQIGKRKDVENALNSVL